MEKSSKYYVYTLAYPDGTVFYVGKGVNGRIDAHERDARAGVQSYKCNVIRKIWSNGETIVKNKVYEGLTSDDAYAREIELIGFYGREHLTNMTNGGEGGEGGARVGAGRPKIFMPRLNIADLQAYLANQQALLNIAEVKAPFLCDDPQWTGLRVHLDEAARNLGVDEWVKRTGEKSLV